MAAALALPATALAQSADPKPWQLNMGRGVTPTAHAAYDAHMIMLWVCVVIGILVFGAMAYAMFKFRKSKGAVPDTGFTHSTKLEAIWTAIPIIILVALAFPATSGLMRMYDTREAEMTVKVTGYQWMWKYEYLGEGVEFTSRLARASDDLRQSGKVVAAGDDPHYLLDVDNALVAVKQTSARLRLQREVVAASRRAFQLAEQQLRAGTADIVTVQVPAPEHAPLQPANWEPLAGVAVRFTTVPSA